MHVCHGGRRGFGFASAMLVLLGVMAVMLVGAAALRGAGGLADTTSSGLQMAGARAQSAGTVALADAGVEMMLQWLSALPAPPAQNAPFAPALWGATAAGTPPRAVVNYPAAADGSQWFSVRIYPDAGNGASMEQSLRYLIEAAGSSRGASATVRAYVQAQSYGRYAYLSDRSSPTSFWSGGVNGFDGPVHCNNSDGAPSSVVWRPGTAPVFQYAGQEAFTVSGAGVRWCQGSPGSVSAPATASDWGAVAAPGHAGVHVGTPRIPLPPSSEPLKQAALGGAAVPTQAGVVVPSSGGATTGGIYIHGDIGQITLGTALDLLGHSTVQQITVEQAGLLGLALTTTITVDPAAGTTTYSSVQLTPGVSVTVNAVYTGLTNGVIYCDGNIGGQPVPARGLLQAGGVLGSVADNVVSGSVVTHANRWTLATDSAKSLFVDGNVLYRTARAKTGGGAFVPESSDAGFTTNAGQLALVSGDIEIGANTLLGVQLLAIEVDGALLAFDTCEAANHAMSTAGTFVNVGNCVVGHDGAFGTLNGAGAMTTGYATFRSYDTRLSGQVPPAYPRPGTYDVLSWQQVSGPLL